MFSIGKLPCYPLKSNPLLDFITAKQKNSVQFKPVGNSTFHIVAFIMSVLDQCNLPGDLLNPLSRLSIDRSEREGFCSKMFFPVARSAAASGGLQTVEGLGR